MPPVRPTVSELIELARSTRHVGRRVLSRGVRYVRSDSAGERAAARSRWRRGAFFALARRFTPTVEAVWPTGRFLVSTADPDVSRTTFVTGPFGLSGDRRICGFVRDVLGAKFDVCGGDILEVGANIGTGSVSFVTGLGARRVHAFEPDPVNFRLLRHNVLANRLDERILTYQVALSNVVGQVSLEISPLNLGDHRVRVDAPQGAEAFDESGRDVIRVPAATVDSLVADGALDLERLRLAWIDIQGHEGCFLEGAQSLLATGIPLVIEFWPYGLERADGLATFIALAQRYYSHVLNVDDMGPATEAGTTRDRLARTSELTNLRDRYPQRGDHTDLVLFNLE